MLEMTWSRGDIIYNYIIIFDHWEVPSKNQAYEQVERGQIIVQHIPLQQKTY